MMLDQSDLLVRQTGCNLHCCQALGYGNCDLFHLWLFCLMKVEQVQITGPRLEGGHPLQESTMLPLVIRCLGEPLKESMMNCVWNGGPVASIVMVLGQERKQIRRSFYSIHGYCSSGIKGGNISV